MRLARATAWLLAMLLSSGLAEIAAADAPVVVTGRSQADAIAAIAAASAWAASDAPRAGGDATPGGQRKSPRIVSLAPNLTEIAYAAGAGDTLVGTVEYSDFPVAARSLPRVGDGWKVDVERVLALRPDFVLAWESGTPQPTIERLEALGLNVVSVATFRLADVPAALRLVGDMAGSRAQAESAATTYEAEVRRLTAAHAGTRIVTVFVEIDDEPLFTVNGRHVISEVVELCGGRNVFADLPQIAPQVSVEAVLARDPQVIVSTDDTVSDPGLLWRRWPQVAAVRAGTIYTIPSDTVARSTPRLVEGVAKVCATLADARDRLGMTASPR